MLTGGQAAIQSLKKEKVENVFGLIGSATMENNDKIIFQASDDEGTASAYHSTGYYAPVLSRDNYISSDIHFSESHPD